MFGGYSNFDLGNIMILGYVLVCVAVVVFFFFLMETEDLFNKRVHTSPTVGRWVHILLDPRPAISITKHT